MSMRTLLATQLNSGETMGIPWHGPRSTRHLHFVGSDETLTVDRFAKILGSRVKVALRTAHPQYRQRWDALVTRKWDMNSGSICDSRRCRRGGSGHLVCMGCALAARAGSKAHLLSFVITALPPEQLSTGMRPCEA